MTMKVLFLSWLFNLDRNPFSLCGTRIDWIDWIPGREKPITVQAVSETEAGWIKRHLSTDSHWSGDHHEEDVRSSRSNWKRVSNGRLRPFESLSGRICSDLWSMEEQRPPLPNVSSPNRDWKEQSFLNSGFWWFFLFFQHKMDVAISWGY